MVPFEILLLILLLLAVIALVVIAWVLANRREFGQAELESRYTEQYRNILKDLRLQSLQRTPEALTPEEDNAFTRYFDLSNEQVTLRMRGVISLAAWIQWSQGMKAMLAQPAIRFAWALVDPRQFRELRKAIETDFADPEAWTAWEKQSFNQP